MHGELGGLQIYVQHRHSRKVLHVATAHRRGGAERNLIHTLEWELAHGWDVHVAVGDFEYQPNMPANVATHIVPHLVRRVTPLTDMRAARALRRLIRDENFDVVHTHQSKAGILGRIAAWHRSPVIVHTVHMPSFGPAYSWYSSTLYRGVERLCAHATDRFVTVGEELRAMYLRAGIGSPEQYSVIRSPVVLARFSKLRDLSSSQRFLWRERFDIPRNAKVILAIGALDRRKRHDVALRQLAPHLRETELLFLIAGEGPLDAELRLLARQLGIENSVRLLGFVDDVCPLLAVADVLIHISEVEGVAQVVLQAMAAGVPIVASDVPGLREVSGAPVLTVADDCNDLWNAVDRTFSAPQNFILAEPSELADWCPEVVDHDLAALHAELEAMLEARAVGG